MTGTPEKTAIVTGASGGIGREVALRLARDGFAVVVGYAGNTARADDVVAKIEAAGGRALAVQADVADAADVERLFRSTLGAFGRIDVVVNSAGIMPMGPIAEGSVEAFDRVIATNLRGTFIVSGPGHQACRQGRPHHRVLEQRHRQVISRLRSLHRLEGRRGGPGPCARQRAARS